MMQESSRSEIGLIKYNYGRFSQLALLSYSTTQLLSSRSACIIMCKSSMTEYTSKTRRGVSRQ